MRKNITQINVIDLFAGPGGLGEGFSSYRDKHGNAPFRIALSVEKDPYAHSTLTLRAFYRQFNPGEAPKEYYEFLKGNLGKSPDDILYKLPQYKSQAHAARNEARQLTLGVNNSDIEKELRRVLNPNDDCIVIGGPPCQAYSVIGRAKRKGDKKYIPENDSRNYLYKEYLYILDKCKPIAFIMENVKGMLSAKINGENIFEKIRIDLENPSNVLNKKGIRYKLFSLSNSSTNELKPTDFIIKSEEYGIPQGRHRVIILGLREDIAEKWSSKYLLTPASPPTLLSIIGSLPKLRSGLSKQEDSFSEWIRVIRSMRKDCIKEIKNNQSLSPLAKEMLQAIESAENNPDSRGENFSTAKYRHNIFNKMNNDLIDWYKDPSDQIIVCNHESRGHIADDLKRYLFVSTWAQVAIKNNWSTTLPKPGDYPSSLLPNHKNFHTGYFEDRFRVQPKNSYSSTITSHISKDGHAYIHYDPAQCRSLTVREAARLQTFPDNYFFLGNRTQQYIQVGNAVPPLLAHKIAERIAKFLSMAIEN